MSYPGRELDIHTWHVYTCQYPSVGVLMDFRKIEIGMFVMHCHMLNHEDQGMMAKVQIWPKSATTDVIIHVVENTTWRDRLQGAGVGALLVLVLMGLVRAARCRRCVRTEEGSAAVCENQKPLHQDVQGSISHLVV